MRDNKMLDLILAKIDYYIIKIVETCKYFHSDSYFENFREKLHLLCEFVIAGTEDENIEYVIEKLKKTKRTCDKMLENLSDKSTLTYNSIYEIKTNYSKYCQIILNTVSFLEQRQESVKLLQEGYSGKCIL